MLKLQLRQDLSSAIIEVYREEKGRLVEYFKKLPNFLHLRITLWKDDVENIIYCCYSVQFTDENWELKKKIIALKNLGHENEFEPSLVIDTTKSLLAEPDWNFDNKLSTLTFVVDAAFYSDDELADEIEQEFMGDNCNLAYVSIREISSKPDDGIVKNSSERLVEFYDTYKELSQEETRDYPYMNVKSDGGEQGCISVLVAVAAILDPRCKLALVMFLYNKLYGNFTANEHLAIIRYSLNKVFNIYERELYRGTSMQDDTYNSLASLNDEEDTIESFQRWYDSKRKVSEAFWKSELDKYLEEPIISSEFDDRFKVLNWWREHASEYPILGRMARDYLTIRPFEVMINGFSAANDEKAMINNPILRGLDPLSMEAMICTKDWLKMEPPQQRKEDLKSKAIAWMFEHIWLVSPFTDKEQQQLDKWQSHKIISGEYVGPDKISVKALKPLLMIPPRNVNFQDARKYYIDDTVVNRFFILLKRRYDKFPHKYLKHHSFDSSMATFLIEGSKNKSDMLSWVKQEDLKGTSKLFLPMCLNEHWLLFCAHIDKKRLLWLDSNRHSQMSHASEKNAISGWFLDFLLPSLGYHQPNEWSHEIPKDIPMQKNSVDCALFVMKYATASLMVIIFLSLKMTCLTFGIVHFLIYLVEVFHQEVDEINFYLLAICNLVEEH
ncbi:Peptidase C48, SUMO/Sentrin/Ubl1 [Corchorus olitorius]|uniref:Peptidase C48, SUMO/Sentrin/Ubl1 n=1 Tax=Corchorus olitorius TaxID=93759 RepID=A0A1R3JF13_9ROSI|nr:Peptidase C48, SUMO/Sentrin/Ubl1 [Corchorus olitorius]